mgnify:CR=1 FL=1
METSAGGGSTVARMRRRSHRSVAARSARTGRGGAGAAGLAARPRDGPGSRSGPAAPRAGANQGAGRLADARDAESPAVRCRRCVGPRRPSARGSGVAPRRRVPRHTFGRGFPDRPRALVGAARRRLPPRTSGAEPGRRAVSRRTGPRGPTAGRRCEAPRPERSGGARPAVSGGRPPAAEPIVSRGRSDRPYRFELRGRRSSSVTGSAAGTGRASRRAVPASFGGSGHPLAPPPVGAPDSRLLAPAGQRARSGASVFPVARAGMLRPASAAVPSSAVVRVPNAASKGRSASVRRPVAAGGSTPRTTCSVRPAAGSGAAPGTAHSPSSLVAEAGYRRRLPPTPTSPLEPRRRTRFGSATATIFVAPRQTRRPASVAAATIPDLAGGRPPTRSGAAPTRLCRRGGPHDRTRGGARLDRAHGRGRRQRPHVAQPSSPSTVSSDSRVSPSRNAPSRSSPPTVPVRARPARTSVARRPRS